MLVLARKVGENILIGDDLVVTVHALRGDAVRLAIDAPKAVRIQRSWPETTAALNRQAAAPPIDAVAALQKQRCERVAYILCGKCIKLP